MIFLYHSPKIQTIYNNANNLSNMINFTTNIADNVSSKVRVLDLAKVRHKLWQTLFQYSSYYFNSFLFFRVVSHHVQNV